MERVKGILEQYGKVCTNPARAGDALMPACNGVGSCVRPAVSF